MTIIYHTIEVKDISLLEKVTISFLYPLMEVLSVDVGHMISFRDPNGKCKIFEVMSVQKERQLPLLKLKPSY